jgi:hypothetical protein
VYNDTDVGGWRRFARKVTGMWSKPEENDFAMIAAASLKHEKETMGQAGSQEARLEATDDEGGVASGQVPSPRRSALKRRRPNYSP